MKKVEKTKRTKKQTIKKCDIRWFNFGSAVHETEYELYEIIHAKYQLWFFFSLFPSIEFMFVARKRKIIISIEAVLCARIKLMSLNKQSSI